jgi:phenylacetate-CoA ligase
MDFLVFIKNNLKLNSPVIGKGLAIIPFSCRPGIGKIYQQRRREITCFDTLNHLRKQSFIYQRFYNIVNYAYQKVPFYRDFYNKKKFCLESLKSYDDIKRVPVINKDILKQYELDSRSVNIKNRYLVNTGGSSGSPLSFYVSSDFIGTEWAHMHFIWRKLGYDIKDMKLVFAGAGDIGGAGIKYDALRHSFFVDIFQDNRFIARKLKRILKTHKVYYLHGYPSALYEFSLFCRDKDPELCEMLKDQLEGVFLGSEYPMPLYRNTIEGTFEIPSVSWYGHTERCVLAYEKGKPFVYHPFQTYGYAESLDMGANGVHHLVGTSYYNLASPLIRYDTEDEVNAPSVINGILESFMIRHGRAGQFILDKNAHKIPLTGLIFGRHHKLFDHCMHIQVAQERPGEALVLYVPLEHRSRLNDPASLFDKSNIAMDFTFRRLKAPVKTLSGKINLLIPYENAIQSMKEDNA